MSRVTGLSYNLRRISDVDRRPCITAGFRAVQAAARRGKRIRHWDPQHAFDEILQLERNGAFCMFVGGILVVAEVITPWYDSRERILQEHLMLRVYDGGTVQEALAALHEYGIRMNCSLVQFSSELTAFDSTLTSTLLAHGYYVAGTNHTKELR